MVIEEQIPRCARDDGLGGQRSTVPLFHRSTFPPFHRSTVSRSTPMARKKITRRDFLNDAGKLAIGAVMAPQFPMIVPRHVLGGKGYTAPSALLNIAVVGVGGQGSGNARS